MTPPGSAAAAYRTLARRAWSTNLRRADELSAIVAAWADSGVLTSERRRRGSEVAHSLRGSAGTFGHAVASEAAGELEHLLSGPPEAPSLERVAALVRRIGEALAEEPELER